MIYEFECRKCKLVKEVCRHHSQSGDPEKCDMCGKGMFRKYDNQRVSGKVYGFYSQAHGKTIKTAKDLKYSSSGRELVEVTGRDTYSPKRKKFEVTREEGAAIIKDFRDARLS